MTASRASDLAQDVADLLTRRGETLAVTESATGGLIASSLTDIPGASEWFRGGLVAYTNDAKERILGVPATTLSVEGAVSAATALAMARGVQRLFAATWSLGETGIAGPQGARRSTKPAGLTYIAVYAEPAGRIVERTERYLMSPPGDRITVKRAFAETSLAVLLDLLRAAGT